jgi:hypothetical protein
VQLLRASAKHKGQAVDLSAVTSGAGDGGVPHGRELIAFADAVVEGSETELAAARAALLAAMGAAALVDTAGVAGLFDAIDRVADATGIPLEDWKAQSTADVRAEIGIDDFAAAKLALDRTG